LPRTVVLIMEFTPTAAGRQMRKIGCPVFMPNN
jgi:hypothetical protein